METELYKGTLSLLILSVLARRPMYGYAIVTAMREDTNGAFEWTEGALYPSLHKLEAAGLIRGQWQGDPGTRRRRYYYLTDKGRRALSEKRDSWKRLCRAVNQVLEKDAAWR